MALVANTNSGTALQSRQRSFLQRFFSRSNLLGYLFVGPWLVGFLVFTFGPFASSFVLGLTHWDMVSPPKFVGFANYIQLFTNDPLFLQSLRVTFIYVACHVALIQVIALALALILNQQLKGISIYRTLFYMPSVTTGVATALLWAQVFTEHGGLINTVLGLVGIQGPAWLFDPHWALPALILMSLFAPGAAMIIYLAGLQGVPQHMYDAAAVDGADLLRRFWHVTIPLLTPTIFYNVVVTLISSFQSFVSAYVITNGGPVNSTLFYVLYLYKQAFEDFRMGYASALAWILFLIILVFTLIQFYFARKWVYYEGAGGKGVL